LFFPNRHSNLLRCFDINNSPADIVLSQCNSRSIDLRTSPLAMTDCCIAKKISPNWIILCSSAWMPSNLLCIACNVLMESVFLFSAVPRFPPSFLDHSIAVVGSGATNTTYLDICLKEISPKTNNNIFFAAFWTNLFRCSLTNPKLPMCPDDISQRSGHKDEITELVVPEYYCTGKEQLEKSLITAGAIYVFDAVLTYANAIQKIRDDCGTIPGDFCGLKTINGSQVLAAARDLEFEGTTGRVAFEQNNRICMLSLTISCSIGHSSIWYINAAIRRLWHIQCIGVVPGCWQTALWTKRSPRVQGPAIAHPRSQLLGDILHCGGNPWNCFVDCVHSSISRDSSHQEIQPGVLWVAACWGGSVVLSDYSGHGTSINACLCSSSMDDYSGDWLGGWMFVGQSVSNIQNLHQCPRNHTPNQRCIFV